MCCKLTALDRYAPSLHEVGALPAQSRVAGSLNHGRVEHRTPQRPEQNLADAVDLMRDTGYLKWPDDILTEKQAPQKPQQTTKNNKTTQTSKDKTKQQNKTTEQNQQNENNKQRTQNGGRGEANPPSTQDNERRV